MDKHFVLGVFNSEGPAKSAYKNLLDTDFEMNDVSMIDGYVFKARGFTTTPGPLRDASLENIRHKIIHLGFGVSAAREIEGYLNEGCTILAATCEEEEFIEDMVDLMNEHGAFDVRVSE